MEDTKLHLGIEAGEVLLKVALYDPKDKKVVKTAILNTETNPLDDVSSFEAALQTWLAENEGVQIDSVSLTVSSFRAIVRQLFVPPEAKNVREYLQWYLGNLVNANVADYVMDFVELGGSAELGRTVLMIAMRKTWVNSVRKGFRNQQIAPKILEVDAISLMNLLEVGGVLDNKLQCVIKADVTGVMLMWASKEDLRALRCCSTLDLAGKDREEAYDLLRDLREGSDFKIQKIHKLPAPSLRNMDVECKATEQLNHTKHHKYINKTHHKIIDTHTNTGDF